MEELKKLQEENEKLREALEKYQVIEICNNPLQFNLQVLREFVKIKEDLEAIKNGINQIGSGLTQSKPVAVDFRRDKKQEKEDLDDEDEDSDEDDDEEGEDEEDYKPRKSRI